MWALVTSVSAGVTFLCSATQVDNADTRLKNVGACHPSPPAAPLLPLSSCLCPSPSSSPPAVSSAELSLDSGCSKSLLWIPNSSVLGPPAGTSPSRTHSSSDFLSWVLFSNAWKQACPWQLIHWNLLMTHYGLLSRQRWEAVLMNGRSAWPWGWTPSVHVWCVGCQCTVAACLLYLNLSTRAGLGVAGVSNTGHLKENCVSSFSTPPILPAGYCSPKCFPLFLERSFLQLLLILEDTGQVLPSILFYFFNIYTLYILQNAAFCIVIMDSSARLTRQWCPETWVCASFSLYSQHLAQSLVLRSCCRNLCSKSARLFPQ